MGEFLGQNSLNKGPFFGRFSINMGGLSRNWRKIANNGSFSTKFLIKLSMKLFIPVQNSEYFATLGLRTNFTVAEVS